MKVTHWRSTFIFLLFNKSALRMISSIIFKGNKSNLDCELSIKYILSNQHPDYVFSKLTKIIYSLPVSFFDISAISDGCPATPGTHTFQHALLNDSFF